MLSEHHFNQCSGFSKIANSSEFLCASLSNCAMARYGLGQIKEGLEKSKEALDISAKINKNNNEEVSLALCAVFTV